MSQSIAVNEEQTANPVTREKIMQLEALLQQLPPVECPVVNLFCNGMFARQMTIPAGVTATGAVHKTEHITVVSKGHLMLMTDDGVVEILAPYMGTSQPGIKRVAHALTETVITTFHATQQTELSEVVKELTDITENELLGGSENVQRNNHLLGE